MHQEFQLVSGFQPFIRPERGRGIRCLGLPPCSFSPMVEEAQLKFYCASACLSRFLVCNFVLHCCPSRKQGMNLGCRYGFYAKRNLQMCACGIMDEAFPLQKACIIPGISRKKKHHSIHAIAPAQQTTADC